MIFCQVCKFQPTKETQDQSLNRPTRVQHIWRGFPEIFLLYFSIKCTYKAWRAGRYCSNKHKRVMTDDPEQSCEGSAVLFSTM